MFNCYSGGRVCLFGRGEIMVTVADVKKYMGEGFEFVAGDIVTDGCKEIVMTAVMANAANYCNSNISALQYRMSGFCLRRNKGIQPVGDDVLVMAVDRKCGEYLDHEPKASSLDWSLGGMDGDVISWRPCLKWIAEQVEKDSAVEINLTGTDNERMEQFMDMHKEASEKVKPVFTQAMADDRELPPVGSEVCLSTGFNGHRKGQVLKVYSHDVETPFIGAPAKTHL